MPSLSPNFAAWQVFGANTDVGKTLITAGLCRAALRAAAESGVADKVYYIKPVQTGSPVDDDARFVNRHATHLAKNPAALFTQTLYSYSLPASPHIATQNPPPDSEVLNKVRDVLKEARRLNHRGIDTLFLETAGGPLSPVMSGTPQASLYRPLRLPTVLVGDSRLGGISATMSAYESLFIRGYDVPLVVLVDDPSRDNAGLLRRQLATTVSTVPMFPPRSPDNEVDLLALYEYFLKTEGDYTQLLRVLLEWQRKRWNRLRELGPRTRDTIWWPFTQHKNVKEGAVTVIDSAYNDNIMTYQSQQSDNGDTRTSAVREELREQFDGFATWWTQGLGHGNPRLALVAANAAAKYGHVPFPECAHEPALDLAEKLLSTVGEGWAQRVFYSDNGSTAMEVALKIALKSTEKRYGMRISSTTPELEIIGIIGAYHGDTIGVMDACAPSIFNREVTWYRPRGHWFDPPTVLYKFGEYRLSIPPGVQPDKLDLDQESLRFSSLSAVFDLSERLDSPTAKVYRTHVQSALSRLTEKDGRKFGALVIEPVLLGSGGMKLVDPLFQRCLVEEVRNWHWYPDSQRGCGVDEQGTWKGLPVVFDEVFTGLWRLGRKSGADILGVNPDIACYAKLLTGGLLPLSVTLTTEAVFGTFLGETKLQALLHGHSYTAHPTGCAVAAEFLKRMKEMAKVETRSARDEEWSIWSMEAMRTLGEQPAVEGVVRLGTLLALTLKDEKDAGYGSDAAAAVVRKLRSKTGGSPMVYTRPLGNVIYLMASLESRPAELRTVEKRLLESLG